ncbi:flippase [Modestobacter sp. URMC 112]
MSGRLARSIGQQGGLRVIGLVIGFVSLSLTTRYLATDEYGQLASAFALVGLFTLLSDFGVNSLVLRRANTDGEDLVLLTRQSLGLTLWYVAPIVVVFLGVGYLFYDGTSYDLLHAALPAYAVGLVATCLSTSLRPLYQQQIRLGYTAVVEVVITITTVVSYLLIVWSQAPAVTVFYVQALYPVLGLVLLAAGQRQFRLTPIMEIALARRLLVEALPIGMAMLIAGIYLRIDVLILAAIVSPAAVGAYGVAYRIFSSITVLSVYIGSTLYPRLATLRRDQTKYRTAYTRALCAALALALPMSVGGVLTAGQAILLISGQGYSDAVVPLAILSAALVPVFLNGLMGNALVIADKAVWFLRMSTVCLIINVALNMALVPHFGIDAAAWATLATESLTLVTIGWVLRADVDIDVFLPLLARVLASTAVMGVVVVACLSAITLPATVLLGVVAYAVAIVLLRVPGALGMRPLGRRPTPEPHGDRSDDDPR